MPHMVVDMVAVVVITRQRKRVVVVVDFLLDLNVRNNKASMEDMVTMPMMKMKATVDMLLVVVVPPLAHRTIHDMVQDQLDYEAHQSWEEEEGHRHLVGHHLVQEHLRSVEEHQP
jgi:hypothetical protein